MYVVRLAKLLATVAPASLVFHAAPVWAQDEDRTIDEIVVTAEHRSAALQDTKISITAFGEGAIKDLGVSNGTDIGQYTPNLIATPIVGGRSGVSFTIRGIGNNESVITFDPPVGTYFDGILISKNAGSLLDVLDLERIEVLRGPQGTLYGRNTIGGAVNYVTKRPTDRYEGRMIATVGNYGRLDLKGMLNIPILAPENPLGELDVRLSAARLTGDGTQKNFYPGARQKELGTRDRWALMGQVKWVPIEPLSLLYSYDYTKINEVPEVEYVTGVNLNTTYGRLLEPYKVASERHRPDGGQFDYYSYARARVEGHSLTARLELGDNAALESLTAHRKMNTAGASDFDGSPVGATFPATPVPPPLSSHDIQKLNFFSQELRLTGSLAESRINYNAGFYYMKENGAATYDTTSAGRPSVFSTKFRNSNWAVYGQSTFSATDKLDLTLGGRYTSEQRQMHKAQYSGIRFDPLISFDEMTTRPALAAGIFPSARKHFNNFSWLATVGYNWSEDVMTYLKYATGYQSGGFNVRDTNPVDFVRGFDPEHLKSYEFGLKSDLASKRIRINAALFFNQYDDKLVNNFNPQTVSNTVRNAGQVEIYGGELEAIAKVVPAVELGANYGYSHKRYVRYDDGRGNDLSKITNFSSTPDHTVNAYVNYERDLDFATFKARADWSYRSKMTFQGAQPERNSSGSMSLFNARLTLEEIKGPGSSKIRVSAWGKNLTNRGYWNFGQNIFSTFGFDINAYGEPRRYGLDLELEF